MNVIEQIQQRLQKYPDLSHRSSDTSITIDPPSPTGFSVSLTIANGEYTVFFDGWHEHFSSDKDALNCLAFGLSDRCRLKVFRRGETEYKWTLEYRVKDGWAEDSTTGLVFFPYWRKHKIVYRQNSIITGDPTLE